MKTIFGSGTFSLKQLMRSGVTNKASQKAFFGNLLSLFMQSGTVKQNIQVPGVPGLRMVVKGQQKPQDFSLTGGPTKHTEQPPVIKSFANFRLAMQTILDNGDSKAQESTLESAVETVILQGIYSVPTIQQKALTDQVQKQEFQSPGVQVKVSMVENQPLLQIKVAESGELPNVLKYVQNLTRKALQNQISLPRIEIDSQEKIPAQLLKDFQDLATSGKLLEQGKLIELPKAGSGEINQTNLAEKSQKHSEELINKTGSKPSNKNAETKQVLASGLKSKAEPALKSQLRRGAEGVNQAAKTLGKISVDTPVVQHKEIKEPAQRTGPDKIQNGFAAAKKAAPRIVENRMAGKAGLKSEHPGDLHTQPRNAKSGQEFLENAVAADKINSAKHAAKADILGAADKTELQPRTARNNKVPLQTKLSQEKSANHLEKNNSTVTKQVGITSKPSLSALEAALNGRSARTERMMRRGQFTQTSPEAIHTVTDSKVKTTVAKSAVANGNIPATAERITTAQTASAIGMVTNRQGQKKSTNQARKIESLHQPRGNSKITSSDKPVAAEQTAAGRIEKAIPSGAPQQVHARKAVSGNIEQYTSKTPVPVEAIKSELSATSMPDTKPDKQFGQQEIQAKNPDGQEPAVKESTHKSQPKAGKEASFSANLNKHSESTAENKADIQASEKGAQEPVALNSSLNRQQTADARPITLATRVPEIIEQFIKAQPRNIGRNTFRISTSPLGDLEINLDVQEKSKQIKIRVASDNAREELQKVLPQIQHNLNVKGIEFTAINIEVMPSGQKAGQANEHQTRNQSRSKQKEERKVRDEHENESTVSSKEYGYNTMEVIA